MGNSTPNPLFSSDENPQAALLDTKQASAVTPSNGGDWRIQFPDIIGRSHKMSKVLETVSKIAKSSSPVLILGESGTGKELIASAIHRLSPRSQNEFIAINCSAIPEDLLESELFGHEKGAFTGADKKRIGKFEAARSGTIFLDEIGDMSPRLQAKLLRVLQEMSLTPLGSNEQRKIDVRVIAATNIDLPAAIKASKFRLDLYYRLNVLPIELPSLKDRENDPILILEHFLERQNRQGNLADPCWFVPEALRILSRFDWPGNIRQLQNVIERLVVIKGGGRIDVEDLPEDILDSCRHPIVNSGHVAGGVAAPQFFDPVPQGNPGDYRTQTRAHQNVELPEQGVGSMTSALGRNAKRITYPQGFGEIPQMSALPEEGMDLTKYVEKIENDLILQALERTNNNKQRAAKLLGLNRTTLVERIKKRKILTLNAPSKEL